MSVEPFLMKWWNRGLVWLPLTSIALCCINAAHAEESGVAYVSQLPEPNTTRLLPALQSTAHTIVLTGNYSIENEFDDFLLVPLPINRNITVTGLPGQLPVLDLQSKPGVLDLCATCTFTFDGVIVGNESSRGTGTMISIFRGKGSSRVQHLNGYGLRRVCPGTDSSLRIINSTLRSTLFPHPQGLQVAHATDVYYQGKLYQHMLQVDDISSDVPLQLLAGGYFIGGYGIHRQNTTRLCQYSVTEECIARMSPDDCAAEIIANLTASNRAAGSNTASIAIAVPVAVGGAALLAAVGGILMMKRRRKQRKAEQQLKLDSNRASSNASGHNGSAPHGSGAGSRAGGSSGLQSALLLSPSQQIEASQDLGLPLLPAAAAGGSGVWELAWRQTAPSMEWAADDSSGIQLGPLLGAGSFARVFKATWAGLDVAVKVIQHDTSTAAVVANEVQLMMHLNHPNIVRAYHCITKQLKPPARMHEAPQHQESQTPAMLRAASGNVSSSGGRHGSGPSSSSTFAAASTSRSGKGLVQVMIGTASTGTALSGLKGANGTPAGAPDIAATPHSASGGLLPQQQRSWGSNGRGSGAAGGAGPAAGGIAGAAGVSSVPTLLRRSWQQQLQQQQQDQGDKRSPPPVRTSRLEGPTTIGAITPQQQQQQQQPDQRRLSVLLPVPLMDPPETPAAATAHHQAVSWPSSALASPGLDPVTGSNSRRSLLDTAGPRTPSGSIAGLRISSATGEGSSGTMLSGAKGDMGSPQLAGRHLGREIPAGSVQDAGTRRRDGLDKESGASMKRAVPRQQQQPGPCGDLACIGSSDSSEGNAFGPKSLGPPSACYMGRGSRTPPALGQQQQHHAHRRSVRSVTSPNLGHQRGAADLAVAVQQADEDVLKAQLEVQGARLQANRPVGAVTQQLTGNGVAGSEQQLGTSRAMYVGNSASAGGSRSAAAATAEVKARKAGLLGTTRALYAPQDSSANSSSITAVSSSSSILPATVFQCKTTPVEELRPGAGVSSLHHTPSRSSLPDAATTPAAAARTGNVAGGGYMTPALYPASTPQPLQSKQQPVAEARTEYNSAGECRADIELFGMDEQQQQQQQQQHGADVAVHGYFDTAPRARRSSAPGQPTMWEQQQQQQQAQPGVRWISLTAPTSNTPGDMPTGAAAGGSSIFQPYIQQRAAYAAADREAIDAQGNVHRTPVTEPSSGSTAWPVMDSLATGSPVDMHNSAAGAPVGNMCETWLVTELCDKGTLARTAADWQPCAHEGDMLKLLWLLQDVVRGLKLLHAKNIVHADLNAHNVLVSSSSTAPHGLVAKIADLGLSRIIKQQATHRTTRTVGTLSHQPPELLQDGHTSTAVDIYSFGVMMWELYTGQAAFARMRYGQIYNQVVLLGARPPVPADMADDYQLLMARCWAAAPGQRPSVDMLLDCLGLMVHDREHPH